MTTGRILVAVDDSAVGLDAARAAVDLASRGYGQLRAITVVRDHGVAGVLGGEEEATGQRAVAAARALLAWVVDLAAEHGVHCDTVARDGEPFRRILEEAAAWEADLVVMGRSDRHGPSSPYLGSETARVLEFTDRPVLVVPRPPERAGD